jgi:ArsR family transcriptional regulator
MRAYRLSAMNDCTPEICVPEAALRQLVEPASLSETTDDELANLAKALGHPVRVKLIRLLSERTTCVYGELLDALPLAQSTVSQHLKVLKDAGLIRGTITGPRTCYCIEPTALLRMKSLMLGFGS